LNKKLTIEKINELIDSGNQWVNLIPNSREYSIKKLSPAAVSGKLDIAVGRVRMLNLEENIISAFTVGDQLLWGAAEPLRRILRILINKAQSS
jgi:aspartate-semialdehyde dehydrogenase